MNQYYVPFTKEMKDQGYTILCPNMLPMHFKLIQALLATYGYRQPPCGIRYMVSEDLGETWSTGHVLYEDVGEYSINCRTEDTGSRKDIGYPATVQCKDGSLITIYYAHPTPAEPSVIYQQRWTLER